jgi:hypothetical protein
MGKRRTWRREIKKNREKKSIKDGLIKTKTIK